MENGPQVQGVNCQRKSNIWFTADTHYSHRNVIKYTNRPFQTIEEMDEILIDNCNKTVNPEDTLYHLGDFAFVGYSNKQKVQDRLWELRWKIRCKNVILLIGNHDEKNREQLNLVFGHNAHDLLTIKFDNKEIVCCHYPFERWNKMHHGTFCAAGHTHNTLKSPGKRRFDCGVDSAANTLAKRLDIDKQDAYYRQLYRPISIYEFFEFADENFNRTP